MNHWMVPGQGQGARRAIARILRQEGWFLSPVAQQGTSGCDCPRACSLSKGIGMEGANSKVERTATCGTPFIPQKNPKYNGQPINYIPLI